MNQNAILDNDSNGPHGWSLYNLSNTLPLNPGNKVKALYPILGH